MMWKEAKILHIFDDEKISKATIELFNKIEGYNQRFLILTNNINKAEKYYSGLLNIEFLENSKGVEKNIYKLIKEFDIIFFQLLSYYKAKALAKNKFKNKIFIWGLWGYELYNFVEYNTKKNKNKHIVERINNYYTFNLIYRKAFLKIDFCLFLLQSDYNLLKEHIKTNAKFVSASYQTIEQITESQGGIKLGDLSPTCDFTFVKETCRGFLEIAESKKTIGEENNIASNYEISMFDTLKLIVA